MKRQTSCLTGFWAVAVAVLSARFALLPDPVSAQEMIDAVRAPEQYSLRLEEVLSIGSLTGPVDDFGRVIGAAVDGRGRILVLDDLSHHFKVFGTDGSHIATVGQEGEGPGEFNTPWNIAAGPMDSVYVWDSGRSHISVFSPDYDFVRNVPVSPAWMVSSIIGRADGTLLVAAVGRGDRLPAKLIDSDGTVFKEAGLPLNAPDLFGYEDSLLGGFLIRSASGYAYTKKSPFEITFFDAALDPVRVCRGPEDLTTDPESVVSQTDRGVSIRWGEYVHSVSILPIPDGFWLNTILDPGSDRRVMHAIDDRCQIIAMIELSIPITPVAAWGYFVLAIRKLDYSEVVLYRVHLGEETK